MKLSQSTVSQRLLFTVLVAVFAFSGCTNRAPLNIGSSFPNNLPQVEDLPNNNTTTTIPLTCVATAPVSLLEAIVGTSGELIAPPVLSILVSGSRAFRVNKMVEESSKSVQIAELLSNSYLSAHTVKLRLNELGLYGFVIQIRAEDGTLSNCEVSAEVVNGAAPPPAQPAPKIIAVTENLLTLDQVYFGENLIIGWNGTDVDSCDIYQNNVVIRSAQPASGFHDSGPLVNPMTIFEFRCINSVGSASAIVAISAIAPPAPPPPPPPPPPHVVSATLTGPSSVAYEASATISWETEGLLSCKLKSSESSSSTGTEIASALAGEMTLNDLKVDVYLTLSCLGLTNAKTLHVRVDPPTDHFIFVTGGVYRGDLLPSSGGELDAVQGKSGADRGDAICSYLAAQADLRGERPWKAILSTSSENARDRITLVGSVYDVNQNKIDYNGTLWSGRLSRRIGYTSTGSNINNEDDVWTGSNASGNRRGDTCRGWTSRDDDDEGDVGSTEASDDEWILDDDKDCDKNRRLYCISQ